MDRVGDIGTKKACENNHVISEKYEVKRQHKVSD